MRNPWCRSLTSSRGCSEWRPGWRRWQRRSRELVKDNGLQHGCGASAIRACSKAQLPKTGAREMGPDIIVPIGFFIMVLGIVLGVPLVRAFTKRGESKPREALPTGDLVARLERIEQAIEAMATEVERVAEGQRFTTKLLSEARPAASPAIAAPQPAMRADGTVLSDAVRSS